MDGREILPLVVDQSQKRRGWCQKGGGGLGMYEAIVQVSQE